MSANTSDFSVKKTDTKSVIRSFYELMKPRVMSLVIFTALVGLIISPSKIDIFRSFISLFFVALGAGAAGALNMWYEAEIDKVMSRTCLRPLPLRKITSFSALWFGIILSIVSVVGLYTVSNLLSAVVLTLTILFYYFVYTVWLKRKTSQNIVIGGAAGALPPVIGWTISAGNISITPLILFLIIFLWTPSHFWALSLYKADDYKKAKIPMLPLISGADVTKKNIFIYSLLMIPAVASTYYFNLSGLFISSLNLILTLYYVFLCFLLLRSQSLVKSNILAKKVFVYSIFYLFLIFLLILIDRFIGIYYG